MEVAMTDFFPFLYEPVKKKEFEPEPLYIELYPPPIEKIEEKETETDKENDNPGVVIIQLWSLFSNSF